MSAEQWHKLSRRDKVKLFLHITEPKKLEKVIKKIEKRLGVKGCVNISNHGVGKAWVQHENHVLSFWTKNGEDDHCHLWHVRHVSDHSDVQTDYFAGSHYSNLTQALGVLKPPPSKFKKGDVVFFKPTKKNARYRRGGTGIVLTDKENADSWQIIQPNGTTHWVGVRDIGKK